MITRTAPAIINLRTAAAAAQVLEEATTLKAVSPFKCFEVSFQVAEKECEDFKQKCLFVSVCLHF